MSDTLNVQIWKRPHILRLLLVALMAEIGYAVLNISSMPVYLKFDRHFSTAIIGLVLTTYLLSEAVFKSYMGSMADHFGRKRLMTFGPAITILTSLLTLLVPNNIGDWEVIIIVFLRILDGIGAAMIWPAIFALMSDTVEENNRQQSMSLLNMCYLLGIALALPIGGILNDLFGEREASFYLASALFTGVTLLSATSISFISPQSSKTVNVINPENQFVFFGELIIAAKKIPKFLMVAFFTFMGVGFPMAIIKLFAEQQFHASESTFGLIALPATIAMAALSMPLAKIGQKVGIAQAVHYGLALCAGGVAIIGMGAFMPFLRSPLILALGALPVGFGFLLAIPAWYTSVTQIDEHKRAANIGAIMTAQGLGTIIGAPLGATCYEKLQIFGENFGRYSPFLGCAVCIIIGWIISLRALSTTIHG